MLIAHPRTPHLPGGVVDHTAPPQHAKVCVWGASHQGGDTPVPLPRDNVYRVSLETSSAGEMRYHRVCAGGLRGGPMGSAGFPPAPRWLFCPPPEADVAFEPARHQHLPDEGETRGTNWGGGSAPWETPPGLGLSILLRPKSAMGHPGGWTPRGAPVRLSLSQGCSLPPPSTPQSHPLCVPHVSPSVCPPVCPPCVPPAVTLPAPCQWLRLCDLSATGIIGFVINYFRQAQPSSCQKSNFFFSINAILG